MTDEEFAGWVLRIFGSWGAYGKSLPEREWVRGERGWYSRAR